jgi:uncharacterized Zn finger protein (UPF0148 family)
MELSTLIVWDYDDTCYLDEDGMVLGVECSICHSLTRSFRDDGMLLACDNCYDEFKMEDSMYHSNIDDMEEDLANAKEEEMEDSMSEMENDLEYCGRMSARCYYCWLEMEHSNRQHGESETEYSKFSSWPSMPEME